MTTKEGYNPIFEVYFEDRLLGRVWKARDGYWHHRRRGAYSSEYAGSNGTQHKTREKAGYALIKLEFRS